MKEKGAHGDKIGSQTRKYGWARSEGRHEASGPPMRPDVENGQCATCRRVGARADQAFNARLT
ncbi:unnamed protein product [Linum tenue]|uniref:Uncharacterized protein n=1 Tax=Linum tenue TaxID=586396 RepID=A0AAV0MDR2_9ROSI|nr:unnamed protein product [Linum tenue]